jgi:uncharacterized protein (DUF697 family)
MQIANMWMKPAVSPDASGIPDQSESTALVADQIIKNHVIVAMATGLIPLPLIFDMVAVTGIEVHMIAALAKAYSFPIPRGHVLGKVLISIAGGIAPGYLSVKFADLLKGLPLAGQAVYLGTLSIAGGAAVYAVGKVFQEHFESGGTFLSLDNSTIRSFFKTKQKEGKALIPMLVKG